MRRCETSSATSHAIIYLVPIRRNFHELLRADYGDYVINAAALAYMWAHHHAGPVIGQFERAQIKCFADKAAWRAYLEALSLTRLAVTPDPVKLATEGALWDSIRAHGLLRDAVIGSDEAGRICCVERRLVSG